MSMIKKTWTAGFAAGALVLSLWVAPTLAAGGGSKPEAAKSGAAEDVQMPDLSAYDADTLRVLAKQLYGVINDLQRRLKSASPDETALRAENRRLRGDVERLQAELTHLRESAPAEKPAAENDPAPEPLTGDLTAAQEKIKSQEHPFAELNNAPADYLGKRLTLLGFAQATDHQSVGVFNDSESPRKFVSLTDAAGKRVYVSFATQGNEKLFKLLAPQGGAKPRVALKVDVMGISTRQSTTFEAAAQSWEVLE